VEYTDKLPRSYPKHSSNFNLASNTWIWILQSLWSLLITLLVISNSKLVIGQVTGEYQAKDPQMAAYLKYVMLLKETFVALELVHIPREQNARSDLLPKLANSG